MSLDLQIDERLKQNFQKIDLNKNGKISPQEFEELLKQSNIKEKQIDKTMKKINKDEEMNFQQYKQFMKQQIWESFQKMDDDKSGYIEVYEVDNYLKKIGFKIKKQVIDQTFKRINLDNDEKLSFDEFFLFFSSLPSPDLHSIVNYFADTHIVDTGSDQMCITISSQQQNLMKFVLAGGFGAISSRTITAPLDNLKIILQTQTEKQTIAKIFQNVLKTQGWKGLFSGNLINCLRVYPSGAITCIFYSQTVKRGPFSNGKHKLNTPYRFLCGSFAGTVATFLTHPLDVLRAQLTINNPNQIQEGKIQIIKNIIKEKSYFRGLSPAIMSIAPFIGISQSTYDFLRMKYINPKSNHQLLQFSICGMIAGATAQVIIHPIDLVRRIFQTQVDKTKINAIKFLKNTIHNQGISRIYQGLGVAVVRTIPATMTSLIVRDLVLGRIE